ncbi:MAG: N-acetylmuramoyl-L-alanine amidase [Flavobacteriia bacterium]|nr:N-acetylmuramoyl-L-alanine amidase [Flavobacteriia bacterium]
MKTHYFSIFVFLLFSFSSGYTSNSFAQNKPFIVVLDAGHGGKDPGNRGNGYFEKDIALNIVLAVGKELEKNKNIKVIYTRKTDVFIELRERSAIANKAKADLFVSIHCNAHHSAASGTETFVLGLHKSQANFEIAKKENQVIYLEDNYQETYGGFDPNSPESVIGLILMQEEYLDQSIEVASYIQDNFTHQLHRNDRSVKQAGFLVLMSSYMPSVLIETGFLTNKEEGAYLNSKNGQQEMAIAISKAIHDYHKSISLGNMETFSFPDNTIKEEVIIKEDIYKDVLFKVQIAASSKKLDPKPQNFKGLKEISRAKEDGLFKYYYGATSNYNKIKNMQQVAKQKGYTSAFIVAFKKEKKVPVSDILKSNTN